MLLCVLAGCAAKQTETAAEQQKPAETAETAEESDTQKQEEPAEIVNIVWQYPAAGEVGPGFQDVEDALNEMLERDIGVHVTLEPCSLDKSQQEASLAISTGEQVDIINTAFTGVGGIL